MMGRKKFGNRKTQLMIPSCHDLIKVEAGTNANGTGSLVFIGDVSADRSSKMNSEVYRATHSAKYSKTDGTHFPVQMDIYCKPNSRLLKANK